MFPTLKKPMNQGQQGMNVMRNKRESEFHGHIEQLTSIKKLAQIQNLLKVHISEKSLFFQSREKMLSTIEANTFKYFKDSIALKEMYEYYDGGRVESTYKYSLFKNKDDIYNLPPESLETIEPNCKIEDVYKLIDDFIFDIRNDNSKMVKIIDEINKDNDNSQYVNFSHLIVHLFYEDPTTCTYNQEELILITYLIFENNFFKQLPASYKRESILGICRMFEEGYSFLSYILNSFTRKPDIRLFLINILRDTILGLENVDKLLIPDISMINVEEKDKMKIYAKAIDRKNFGDNQNNEDEDEYSKMYNDMSIEEFMVQTSLTRQELNNLINGRMNENSVRECDKAYKELLARLRNQIKADREIYSTEFLSKDIFSRTNQENFEAKCIIYKDNYIQITSFINKIFEKLYESIDSLPYSLKCMFYILSSLLALKYGSKGGVISAPDIYLIKSKFFFHCWILPIIFKPQYNGTVYNTVLSEITNDNIRFISAILEKIISCELYDVRDEKDPQKIYTIFNRYIIYKIYDLFQIIDKIELASKSSPPDIIKNLSLSDMNSKRKINYDYFSNNKTNIKYQCVCFSNKDLEMLLNIVERLKGDPIFKTQDKLYDRISKFRIAWVKTYNRINAKEKKYTIISRIEYNQPFVKEYKFITEDYISNYFKSPKKIQKIKRCLVDLIIYSLESNKSNIYELNISKDNRTLKSNKSINQFISRRKNIFYRNSGLESEPKAQKVFKNRNLYADPKEEDADFIKEILPSIITLVQSQITDSNNDKEIDRILFAISFLEFELKNLDPPYIQNNYNKLLSEIILDVDAICKNFKNSLLNDYYSCVRGSEKVNLIINNYYSQIKCMEQIFCIKNFYKRLELPDFGYTPTSIEKFIENFENYLLKSNENTDLIELEFNEKLHEKLRKYFKDMYSAIKSEKFLTKFTTQEILNICFGLEDYVYLRLYEKMFPYIKSKVDNELFDKCCNISRIKQENFIKEKLRLNEDLLKKAMKYINNMDNCHSPVSKMREFGKAFQIIQNAITFSSGKTDFGVDDTLQWLVYVIIKARPRMLNSNYEYCDIFLNPEQKKNEFGVLLMQMGMALKIIGDMTNNDFTNVKLGQLNKVNIVFLERGKDETTPK